MQLNITARHLELTPALSEYVHRKIEKAQRYFDSIIWAQAILSVEKHRHIAEFVVHLPGNTFRTQGEAGDLYSAVDLAAHKLELHLSRVKDKLVRSRTRNGKSRVESESAALAQPEPDPLLKKISVTKVVPKPLSLRQAVEELDDNGRNFLPFINEQTNQMGILYKKGKKGYGLVEVEG